MIKPVELSGRLLAAAGMVTPGGRAVDVGCDHGWLPIYLLEQGICTGAVAADLREGPLSRAREHIRQHGLERCIETRISDGLKAVRPGEGETLVLAGMGGPLMERILTESPAAAASFREIIAQPQSDIPHFRRFAVEAGLTVTAEEMVEEDGKFYVIMRMVPCGEFPRNSQDHPAETRKDHLRTRDECFTYEELFGTFLPGSGSEAFAAFLERELKNLREIEASLVKGSSSGRACTRLGEIRRRLVMTERAMRQSGLPVRGNTPGERQLFRTRQEKEGMEKKIKVTLDGVTREVPWGISFADLLKEDAGEQKKTDTVLAVADGKLQELYKSIRRDCTIERIGPDHPVGKQTRSRTTCMVLFKAIHDVLGPESRAFIHFAVPDGYYFTLTGSEGVKEKVLDQILKRMHELVDARIPIIKKNLPLEDAQEIFHRQGMADKERLLWYRKSTRINLYCLEDYWDYYYGFMGMDTGYARSFDLEAMDEGFVLKLPQENPEMPGTGSKLFRLQKDTENWSRKLGLDTVGALNDRITSDGILEVLLMQETVCENQIAKITKDIMERENIRFVMVAGPSSSGKTSFSHRLGIQLSACGRIPHPIALDDYFLNREDTPLDEFGEKDYECLEALDIQQFNRDMLSLLDGREVELPSFNFVTGKREYKGRKLKVGSRDILIIEGIHGLNDGLSYSLPAESKYKIYISPLTTMNIDEHNIISPLDSRLIRRMVRDARTRGIRVGETIQRWASVRRGEEKHIFPFREEADVIFNSYQVYEMSALKVYAEPLLAGIRREDPAYLEARRLLKLMDYFLPVPSDSIPRNSILREFIGGSCFPVG